MPFPSQTLWDSFDILNNLGPNLQGSFFVAKYTEPVGQILLFRLMLATSHLEMYFVPKCQGTVIQKKRYRSHWKCTSIISRLKVKAHKPMAYWGTKISHQHFAPGTTHESYIASGSLRNQLQLNVWNLRCHVEERTRKEFECPDPKFFEMFQRKRSLKGIACHILTNRSSAGLVWAMSLHIEALDAYYELCNILVSHAATALMTI